MDPQIVQNLHLKSLDEIVERLKEFIHRYRRRFLKRNSRPCPNNCKMAEIVGRKVLGCAGCGSQNPDLCIRTAAFKPMYDKDELYEQFRQELRNPEILLREYRDLVALFWVIGAFDAKQVDEQVIAGVEKRVEKSETTPRLPDQSIDPNRIASVGASSTATPEVNHQPTTATNPRVISRQRGVGKVQGNQ